MTGLSLCLVLVVGVFWVVRDEAYVAPRPQGPDASISPTGAAGALRQLERAVATGDVASAVSLAAAGDRGAAAALRAVVDNASEIGVENFTLRYVDSAGGIDDAGRWPAVVETTWRFRGFDRVAARAEVEFQMVAEAGRTAIAGVGGETGRTPVWLSGPLQVRRGQSTLVLAAEDPARYARLATVAVPAVREVVTSWRTGLVVEVAESGQAVAAALGADDGEYDAIAAVTSNVGEQVGLRTPVHVVVNPDVFADLDPQGAQVVMTHEAAHVATGAAVEPASVPPWLTEGYADYVALRDVDLPLSVTAAQIVRQVRREGPPRALPGDGEFDTRTTHLGAAYEAAWLACRLLVERAGEQALTRFYLALDAEDDVAEEFRRRFGFSLAEFTRQWRQRLSDLAA